jgi:hypothetical protein
MGDSEVPHPGDIDETTSGLEKAMRLNPRMLTMRGAGPIGADPIGSRPIGTGSAATSTVFSDAGCGCEPSLATRSGNERRRTVWS